jgi:hypothetical protein
MAAPRQAAQPPADEHVPGRGHHAADGTRQMFGSADEVRNFPRRGSLMPGVFYGVLTQLIFMCVGLVLMLQAMQVALMLGFDQQGSIWTGCWQGLSLVLRSLLAPFVEEQYSSISISQAFDVHSLGLWFPAFLSAILIVTACLGFSTLRYRHPSCAVPYALLAAILLVGKAELGVVLKEVARWEDLGLRREPAVGSRLTQAEVKKMQSYFFKMSYEAFSDIYKAEKCSMVNQGNDQDSNWIRCFSDTLEANLVELVVQELCQPTLPSRSGSFTKRVRSCRKQGHELQLLSQDGEAEEVYCRCWCGFFTWLQVASYFFVVIWFGMLLGVLSVIYAAAEPKLSRMGTVERAEVLTFASVVMLILAFRVTVFSDGFPYSDSASSLLALL